MRSNFNCPYTHFRFEKCKFRIRGTINTFPWSDDLKPCFLIIKARPWFADFFRNEWLQWSTGRSCLTIGLCQNQIQCLPSRASFIFYCSSIFQSNRGGLLGYFLAKGKASGLKSLSRITGIAIHGWPSHSCI